MAETNPGLHARLLARAQAVFVAAQSQFTNEPTNQIAAWEFARAGFDRPEFATNDTERAALAVLGIDACKTSLATRSLPPAITTSG